MALIKLNLKPSQKDLRWFAGVWWPLMCVIIGRLLLVRAHSFSAAMAVWVGGGLIALAGLIWPNAIRPLFQLLLRITYPIGFCVSHAIFALLYYAVITPIGALMRRFHDPMERAFHPGAPSYWAPRETSSFDRYFRQL